MVLVDFFFNFYVIYHSTPFLLMTLKRVVSIVFVLTILQVNKPLTSIKKELLINLG